MYFYSSYCKQVCLSAALHGTVVKGIDFWAGQFGQTLTLLHMIFWLFGKLLNSWSFQFLSHQVGWLSAWVRIKWDSAGKNLVEYLLRNSRILNTWKRLWSSINLSIIRLQSCSLLFLLGLFRLILISHSGSFISYHQSFYLFFFFKVLQLFFFLLKKLEYNCFTVLCFCCPTVWISYMCTYLPSLSSLHPTSHSCRLSQRTELSSLCYTAASH